MPYSRRLFHLLQASWCALPKVTSYMFTLRLRLLALKSQDFGLDQICRGCGECITCTPCPMTTPTPAPEMIPSRVPTTSPVSVPAASPTEIMTPSTPEPTEHECSVCFNITSAQEEALGSYDNGGKKIVCDPTCLDGVTDPIHCNCEYDTFCHLPKMFEIGRVAIYSSCYVRAHRCGRSLGHYFHSALLFLVDICSLRSARSTCQ